MRAIVSSADGPVLRDSSAARQPRPEEVLVRVRAAGLNRADLDQARPSARRRRRAWHVLGLEWAGEVVEVGGEVERQAPATG